MAFNTRALHARAVDARPRFEARQSWATLRVKLTGISSLWFKWRIARLFVVTVAWVKSPNADTVHTVTLF